jgi:GDPmannose 4,6-dehydratase
MTTTNNDRKRQEPPVALICGVTGQDGAYLAKHLVESGYRVIGTTRDASTARLSGLMSLGIDHAVDVVSMASNDFRSVLQTIIRAIPDEIYNLAGQTSVGLSFEQPVEAIESITLGTLNLLEAIRFVGRPMRLYNAGSSECFGDTNGAKANEETPFKPRSPYAVAKACSHNLIANYREAYGMYCCTGILFNHESPLRPQRFVTQKVVSAARRIAAGRAERLRLGNLDIHRDWGWAPEYVEVMHRMLQNDQPRDYVIATGRTVSLGYFVQRAFAHFGLDWSQFVDRDPSLLRPSDIRFGAADVARARADMAWAARFDVDHVVDEMCRAAPAPGAART